MVWGRALWGLEGQSGEGFGLGGSRVGWVGVVLGFDRVVLGWVRLGAEGDRMGYVYLLLFIFYSY